MKEQSKFIEKQNDAKNSIISLDAISWSGFRSSKCSRCLFSPLRPLPKPVEKKQVQTLQQLAL